MSTETDSHDEMEDLLDGSVFTDETKLEEFRSKIKKRRIWTWGITLAVMIIGPVQLLKDITPYESIPQVIGMILGAAGVSLLPAFLLALPIALINFKSIPYKTLYWNMYWWITFIWSIVVFSGYAYNIIHYSLHPELAY